MDLVHILPLLNGINFFGLRNDTILRRLLSEQCLTFEKAIDISSAMELAIRDAASLHHKNVGVNKIQIKFRNHL